MYWNPDVCVAGWAAWGLHPPNSKLLNLEAEMRARSLFLLGALLVACGGGEGTDPVTGPQTPPWENTKPALYVASPGALSVGEKLEILGKDFIQPDRGYPVIVFKGTYFDDQNASHTVDLQAKAKCVGSVDGKLACAKLAWSLWPNIVFHPTGDKLGYFLGSVAVINVGNDGSQKVSDRLQVKLEVRPSLIPRMARPTNAACQAVVDSTLEDTPMGFVVEAVGLRPASEDNPIIFYWSFLLEQWQVSTSYNTMNPDSIMPDKGAIMLEEQVTSGRTSSLQDGGDRNFLLKIGSDMFGSARLKTLKTGKIPDDSPGGFATTVNVAAMDASGKTVQLSMPVQVHPVATMHYDGEQKIAQRFPPVQVSDCIPGGDIGRNVSYSEDKAESRSRSMSFQYNASVGLQFAPIPSNPFALGINFSAGFGVDVGASVSTSKSKGMNISGQVLPGEFGVFYRQTTMVYRIGKLIGHNACGQTADLGEAILTDWMFTPELATGPSCTPPSLLPPAGKFL